jgi:hypothetical protein
MIVQLTPKYKFVCDRCGREQFPDKENCVEVHDVAFCHELITRTNKKSGQVCKECYDEFWELAENFFAEENKEKNDERR